MAARCLHCFPQSHQTDGALVLALQGRVELHVVALRLVGEGGGRAAGAAAPAAALLLGGGAAGAGHGRAAAALRLPAPAAALAVQQAHGTALPCNRTKGCVRFTYFKPSLQATATFISNQKYWNRLGSIQNQWLYFVPIIFFYLSSDM